MEGGDMFRGVRGLRDCSIGTLDGHIGRVRDAYFDDQAWTIRYLVVDTGHWLAGRRVLISPLSLHGMEPTGKVLPSSLTKAQVAESPDVDTEKPVSRQHELEFYQYYGLPYYWLSDADQVPLAGPVMPVALAGSDPEDEPGREGGDDLHLRSAQVVTHYYVRTRDANIGHVADFLFDDGSWRIGYVVIATGSWWPGRHVLVPVTWIEGVSWAANTLDVGLHSETVKLAPEYDGSRPPSPEYLTRLAAYYGPPSRPSSAR
jgi:hypothetical protein